MVLVKLKNNRKNGNMEEWKKLGFFEYLRKFFEDSRIFEYFWRLLSLLIFVWVNVIGDEIIYFKMGI